MAEGTFSLGKQKDKITNNSHFKIVESIIDYCIIYRWDLLGLLT